MSTQPVVKLEEPMASAGLLDKLPIDMALNHGTYSSERCAEVLRKYNSTTSFRLFPSKDNRELREVIAKSCGVAVENVFVANGSGPLLKTCLPYVCEKKIKSSPVRMLKHLAIKKGYPITTPRLTYFKVPHGAVRQAIPIEFLPLEAENGFKLSTDAIAATLSRNDGLVYVSNPNNPTGNVLLTREQVLPLMKRFPESTFVIDEAYVDYIPEEQHRRFPDLVPQHDNLLVMRSLSFAHGLGGARIGYIIAPRELVTEFEQKTTPHAVSSIASDLAIASINDPDHMKFVQRETQQQRNFLIDGLRRYRGLEVFDSLVNFFLARFTDGRSAHQLYSELLGRGVRVKIFEPIQGESYEEYFRITVGLPEENRFLLEQIDAILG